MTIVAATRRIGMPETLATLKLAKLSEERRAVATRVGRKRGTARLRPVYWITPQAMRPPASPVGSVL